MTWVFIDISFLCHRALHTMPLAGFENTIIFSVLRQIKSVCEDPFIQSNKVIAFFDSFKSFRRDVYPEYKAKRKQKEKTEEELLEYRSMVLQTKELRRKVLPRMGVSCVIVEGLESDDTLAMASRITSSRKEKAAIVTADGDLFQCINEYTFWFDPMRRILMTPGSFRDKYLVEPEQWAKVKKLAGCTTDNVKGIKGVGEKTAIKYLLGELPKSHKTYERIVSLEGRRIRRVNQELVVLPHPKTMPFDLIEPQWDLNGFLTECQRLNFNSMIKESRSWETFFKGPKTVKTRMRS